MVDFYEERFSFKIFINLFLLGLITGSIFIPSSFFLHSIGHGLFGVLSGCDFIGIYLPSDKHSNAILNYPTAIFSGTKGSIPYWLGGHFFIFILMIGVFLMPTTSSIIQMIFFELFGFYLSFYGGFLEGFLSIYGEEAKHLPEILKINPYIFLAILSLFFLIFSFVFFFRLISFFGRSFKDSIIIPLFLSFTLIYIPAIFYLIILYLLKGFVVSIHFPVYLILTIFFFISPLIPRGKKIWQKPKFTKPIYGFFLLLIFVLCFFYFSFYAKDFPVLLWGQVKSFCNLPLEVKL